MAAHAELKCLCLQLFMAFQHPSMLWHLALCMMWSRSSACLRSKHACLSALQQNVYCACHARVAGHGELAFLPPAPHGFLAFQHALSVHLALCMVWSMSFGMPALEACMPECFTAECYEALVMLVRLAMASQSFLPPALRAFLASQHALAD